MPSVWERFFGIEADDIALKGQLARTGQQYVQAAASTDIALQGITLTVDEV